MAFALRRGSRALGRLFNGLRLVHVLLLATIAELVFNRLAAVELRPSAGVPPLWHRMLDHFGLFCHYFASMLAIGLIARTIVRLRWDRELVGRSLRWSMAVAGLLFVVLATFSVVTSPEERLSFWFESSFTVVMLILLLSQVRTGGDPGVKIGILFLALPLMVHFYSPFAFRFLDDDDLPQRVRNFGQWSMVLAALATPYCFAPRPFFQSAARLGPFVIAMFVSMIGILIVRQHYEEGMRLAQEGLGIYIGPDAPTEYLALHLIALGTVTWTLTSALTADALARREIGVGLGLIVVAGYGFAWPLQYLVSLVGLIHINQSARQVVSEEKSFQRAAAVHAPPIADAVWAAYVTALHRTLQQRNDASAADMPAPASTERLERQDALPLDDDEPRPPRAGDSLTITVQRTATITHRRSEHESVTVVVTRHHEVEVQLLIERNRGSITLIQIACEMPGDDEPAWTLYARPERLLGIGAHPEPPATRASRVDTGDRPFDGRFLIRDAGGLTATLMDEGIRARAIALIDGWLAFWPECGLLYRVEPGNGAPLDHPIPISELAFRGARAEPVVDRLVAVLDLLVDITRRGLGRDAPS